MKAAALALALAASAGTAAAAEAWPQRPLRFIVPFPPGSATDSAARVVALRLADALGQQVVIDNRSGASGSIGVELAARAAPDGHTLLLCTASTHAVAPALNPKLAYDPIRDFAPVSLIGSSPYVLAVHPSVAAASTRELIAQARAKPGRISYASAGNASLAHLAGELFSAMAGVSLNHVPYKSSALSVVDVLAGRIELVFGSISPTLPHIRGGRLRALATTGSARLPALAEVPTVAEAALPGYEIALWMGILLPANAPPAVTGRLNREVTGILRAREVREALASQGVEASPGTPGEFRGHMEREIAKFRTLVRTAKIAAE